MAPHSSTFAWRIPGTEEPGGLPSMGSHRVGQDWSDLAAAAGADCYYWYHGIWMLISEKPFTSGPPTPRAAGVSVRPWHRRFIFWEHVIQASLSPRVCSLRLRPLCALHVGLSVGWPERVAWRHGHGHKWTSWPVRVLWVEQGSRCPGTPRGMCWGGGFRVGGHM